MIDNTGKFTGLGAIYARSRPGYPAALLDMLVQRVASGTGRGGAASVALDPSGEGSSGTPSDARPVVADIGAGTGKLTAELLRRDWDVIAVEPNDDMRAALTATIGEADRLTVVGAPAETTGLDAGAISLVTVAQAFHWFDIEAFRAECRRILVPGGQAALIWNFRRAEEESVDAVIEAFRVRVGGFTGLTLAEKVTDVELARFYGGSHYQRLEYDNDELITWDTFRERHLSLSFAPKEGDPAREPLIEDLQRIFDRYAVDGLYRFPNSTHVLVGDVR
jgi:SAM-dependent methyltransferase